MNGCYHLIKSIKYPIQNQFLNCCNVNIHRFDIDHDINKNVFAHKWYDISRATRKIPYDFWFACAAIALNAEPYDNTWWWWWWRYVLREKERTQKIKYKNEYVHSIKITFLRYFPLNIFVLVFFFFSPYLDTRSKFEQKK